MERFSGQRLRFTKGHGTENDFVLLYDPEGFMPPSQSLVRFLCDRRAGVGGDGLIRAVKTENLPEGEGYAPGTWFMDYWNADGSVSEMCGNGVRVFAAFLEREAGAHLAEGLLIGTRAGQRTVTSLGGGRYAVGMGQWSIPYAQHGADSTVIAPGVGPRPGLSVDVGNPHTVVALSTMDELTALDLTAPPRVEPAPEFGSNVEFVVPLGESLVGGERRGVVRMRVHERGSGETKSCGTGAVATALAVRLWAGQGAPDVWDVQVPGGTVTVRIVGEHSILEGPAVLVAEGSVAIP